MTTEEAILSEPLLSVVRESGSRGMTYDEIRAALSRSGSSISTRELRALLRELSEAGTLDVSTRPVPTGRPAKIYLLRAENPQPSLFDDVRARDDVVLDLLTPDQKQQVREEHGFLAQVALDHLSRDRLVEAVREAVPQLAKQEPVTLILDFAESTTERLRQARQRALDAQSRGDRAGMEDPIREFEFVSGAARRYFRDLFQLHRGLHSSDRVLEILDTERVLNSALTDDDVIFFDRSLAEQILRRRVLGDSIIGLVSCVPADASDDVAAETTITATDASTIPLSVRTRPTGSYELPETLMIFTGAASQIQPIGSGTTSLVDYDLDPGFLASRDEVRAAEQGWMFTEHMQVVIGEGHSKYAISAAQELRQYRRDTDVLSNRIEWKGVPGVKPGRPDALVRDGRLFPLVHRLKDYEADGLYGQIVRNEIKEFALACRLALDDYEYLAYGAFVKRPFTYFLAPLVFFFCRHHLGMTDRVTERMIFRPPLGDTLLSFILLNELIDGRPPEPGTFATTFRVIRRYSDLALLQEVPRLADGHGMYRRVQVDDSADWAEYFRQRRQRIAQHWHERLDETPPLPDRDYGQLRLLCHRIGIAMGFALPADGRLRARLPLRLPRVEVMIDLEGSEESWDAQYRRLLSAFQGPDSLVLDDDHPDGSAIKLIIPKACREAHRAAVYADDVYRRNIERRLIEAVAAVERTIVRRPRQT